MGIGCVHLSIFAVLIHGSLEVINGPIIQQVTKPVDHSEGPTWDGRENVLYYVDIHSGRVFAYHYHSNQLTHVQLNGEVTPVNPSKHHPNLFLVGLNRSVVAVEWNSLLNNQYKTKVLSTVSEDFPSSRFNDGKADSKGRLWWGTIGAENSSGVVPCEAYLYKFTRVNLNNPTIERKCITNSNGLAWNKANDKMYYIDTPTLKVVEFDFNAKNGTISDTNRTAFDLARFSQNITGVPDGMTIDTDDNLWVALYGGGSVIKVNPKTGNLLKVIALPARDVTSAMWGGPNLDILFVTTSRISLSDEDKKKFPAAGSVFAIKNLKAKGLPMFGADIVDSF